jgi:hypothetical protein
MCTRKVILHCTILDYKIVSLLSLISQCITTCTHFPPSTFHHQQHTHLSSTQHNSATINQTKMSFPAILILQGRPRFPSLQSLVLFSSCTLNRLTYSEIDSVPVVPQPDILAMEAGIPRQPLSQYPLQQHPLQERRPL